jgi:hypothetical protein
MVEVQKTSNSDITFGLRLDAILFQDTILNPYEIIGKAKIAQHATHLSYQYEENYF